MKTLLERPDMPPEDKQIIKGMLEKPWNPYIRRHTSLTERARMVNEYSLRLHAGWAKNSKMIEIYTHELGGESSKELLAAYGVVPREVEGKRELLKPKECPNCREPNKPDARFCASPKCGMPLTFDAFREQKEKEQEKEQEIKKFKEDTDKKIDSMKEEFKDIIQGFVMKYAIRDNKTDDPRYFQSLLNGSEEIRKDGRFDAMLERVKSDIAARKKAIEDLYEKGGELPEVRLVNGNFIPAMCILPRKKAQGVSPKN